MNKWHIEGKSHCYRDSDKEKKQRGKEQLILLSQYGEEVVATFSFTAGIVAHQQISVNYENKLNTLCKYRHCGPHNILGVIHKIYILDSYMVRWILLIRI